MENSLINPSELEIYQLGINLVVISIVLSAIAIGFAKAINSRKMFAWGVEELIQAIINGALLGIIFSGSIGLSNLASSLVDQSLTSGCNNYNDQPTFIKAGMCKQDKILDIIYNASEKTYKQSAALASLSLITIKLNVIEAMPLYSLKYASEEFSKLSFEFLNSALILETVKQIILFFAKTGFSIFLPIGLLLRMFFMTRKVGGAIIAGAIGFYIFFPLFLLSFGLDLNQMDQANVVFENTINELAKISAPFPQIDWSKEQDIINLVFSLGQKDLALTTSAALKVSSQLLSLMQLYSYIYVGFAILTTFIFIYQLASIFGLEFNLDIYDKI
jgi:hypothetical protein